VDQKSLGKRIAAVIEVIVVCSATLTIIWSCALLPLGQVASRFVSYAVKIALPLLLLFATRRDLAAYGISLRNFSYDLDVALTAFIPFAVSGAIYGWLLPLVLPSAIIRWEGGLILSAVQVATLFWVARMLRRKPTKGAAPLALISLLPLALARANVVDRLVSFIFYLLFLGPGEEILFRGYVQSRLNRAFGRPYRFFDVNWGWGLVLTSLLFGALHIVGAFNPFLGRSGLHWWWGLWTFFGGFVEGYLREKTGSVVAPAILHGLPQAIASLAFGFFSVR
jgi:membrane protease YdiL (CAAX protease family)